jgi:hypothetical protein
MTPQEALNWCEQFTENLVMVNVDTKKRTLGLKAMQTCKSALEKQIPKKVIKKIEFSSYEYISYRCPICNRHFLSKIEGDFVAGTKPKYCYECGQALDWGEDNE